MREAASHLVVVAFDDEYKADEARLALRRMHGEALVQLEETSVVVVGLDGKKRLDQEVDLVNKRKMQGHWLGILAAAVVEVPPLILVGTVAGAVIGKLTDHGVTNAITNQIGKSLRPGTSALFVYGHRLADRETIVERLRPLGGKLAHTTLNSDAERELAEALEAGPAA
jgi:uncharacterized membrane protein